MCSTLRLSSPDSPKILKLLSTPLCNVFPFILSQSFPPLLCFFQIKSVVTTEVPPVSDLRQLLVDAQRESVNGCKFGKWLLDHIGLRGNLASRNDRFS